MISILNVCIYTQYLFKKYTNFQESYFTDRQIARYWFSSKRSIFERSFY